MGNHNRPARSHSNVNQPQQAPQHVQGQGNLMKCPKCHFQFPPGTNVIEVVVRNTQYADHIRNCIVNNSQIQKIQNNSTNLQYEKVPIDYTMTKFRWQKKPIQAINPQILQQQAHQVKKLSFQEKEYWFRNKIQKLRISWELGADFMKLQRSNILMCSFMEAKKVNMHKEVKIQFIGEKVNDAGGLLREWIHMVFKEIFDDTTGIFMPANTDDISYKLKWDEDLDEEFSGDLFELFGTILGKAIFQKIPLNCYLDRTILRQLCDCPVKIQDIYGFDKDLYKNWIYILEENNVEELDVYFVINKDMGDTIEEVELKEGGMKDLVNDQNKFQYVDLCVQTMTMAKVERSIKRMQKGLMRVIPHGLLQIFEPFQLEMLVNGVPFIDLEDWRMNTMYQQPYNQNHQVVRWFWSVMEKFDQDQLAHILHFCTGSSRTPIHGFKKLESNRGNYSKFLIVAIPFDKINPFPKGHTCFNRLELPIYPSLQSLSIHLTAISKSNLDGVFGLD